VGREIDGVKIRPALLETKLAFGDSFVLS
jgi:hypothetical protein